MQRPTTLSRAPEEHQINIMQQQTPRTDETEDLPTFNPLSEIGRRASRRSRSSHYSRHWIHCIPVIVFLCFFILWWFSYPGNTAKVDIFLMSSHSLSPAIFNILVLYSLRLVLLFTWTRMCLVCLGVCIY